MTAIDYLARHQGETLCMILSAGSDKGSGHLEKLKRYELDQILKAAGIPVPEFRDTAEMLARHVIEIEYYTSVDIKPKERIDRCIDRMHQAVKFWTSGDGRGFMTPPPTDGSASKRSAAEVSYSIDLKGPRNNPLHPQTTEKAPKGQAALVVAWLHKHPAGGSARQIADALVADGFKCNQDPFRAVYYYLNEFKKKGWVQI